MKIIHRNGFTREDLLACRSTVYRNVLESAQNIAFAMRKFSADCEEPHNRVRHNFTFASYYSKRVGLTFILPFLGDFVDRTP
jgi:hypothetical protein